MDPPGIVINAGADPYDNRKPQRAMESAGPSEVVSRMRPANAASCSQPPAGGRLKQEVHDGEKIWRRIR
jgi:hypothetical protein